jgi:hypothetical protein
MLSFSRTLACTFTLLVSPSFAATQIYTYRDDSGTQIFTTELDSIPEHYRSRAIQLTSDKGSPVGSEHANSPPASVRVITAFGEYRMGDHDTRADAIRLALETAKLHAIEEVATYIEGITMSHDMDLARNDIRSYTAGVVTVVNQQITTRLDGETVVIRVDLTAKVDPNQVMQAITVFRDSRSVSHELNAFQTDTGLVR